LFFQDWRSRKPDIVVAMAERSSKRKHRRVAPAVLPYSDVAR
jgi:hypothetical protein